MATKNAPVETTEDLDIVESIGSKGRKQAEAFTSVLASLDWPGKHVLDPSVFVKRQGEGTVQVEGLGNHRQMLVSYADKHNLGTATILGKNKAGLYVVQIEAKPQS